jgi:hypothetical protein
MRPHRAASGALLAAFLLAAQCPAHARAQSRTDCLRRQDGAEALGALIGGGVGALVGNGLGRGGGRTGATVIGGVGGAALGAAVGGTTAHCGENEFGYYDPAGRWVSYRATSNGYQGPDGRWVDAPPPFDPPAAGWNGVPVPDTRQREARIATRIDEALADGSLGRKAAARDLRGLDDIRRIDTDYHDGDGGGALTRAQRADIQARLEGLETRLAAEMGLARAR